MPRRSLSFVSAVVALALLAGAPRSQEKIAKARTGRGDAAARAPFVFEPGEIALDALITRCAGYLQRNILVDTTELLAIAGTRRNRLPQQPRQAPPPAVEPAVPTVEFTVPVVTDAAGCEELLSGLLWAHGLVMLAVDRQKDVYEVLAMAGPRAREVAARAVVRSAEEVLARPALREFVTVVCSLQHVDAMTMVNGLRGPTQNTAQLTFGTFGTSGTLTLTGPQDQVAIALQIVALADVPAKADASPGSLGDQVRKLTEQCERLRQRLEALEKRQAGDL